MPAERRALLILLSLAVAGQGVRYWVTRPGDAPGDVRILADAPSRSPAAQARTAVEALRPLAAGERVNADTASARELARLPRVGMSLARRIVADRDSNGPFGGLAGLDRVPGIGPGMLKSLEPHLEFSRTGPSPARLSATVGRPESGSAKVNVNTASARELEALPMIGASRALAIVEWRTRHGSFAGEADLVRVPGVSERMVKAIRERIAF